MKEFFKGWRRKAGCVTLLLACVAMGSWIRGIGIQDSFWFGFAVQESHQSGKDVVNYGKIQDTLSTSAKDGIVWGREECEGNLAWSPGWKTHPTENNDFFDPFEPGGNPLKPELVVYHWQLFGLDIAKYHEGKTYQRGNTYSLWRISYSSIVIPLALISFWLLLSKPHKTIPMKLSEPTANEGM